MLLCVHELGLNSASYEDFGKRMSNLDIATFAVDVRGFGTWMQFKGKEEMHFDACVGDVKQATDVLHKAYQRTPVFILGQLGLRNCHALYGALSGTFVGTHFSCFLGRPFPAKAH